MITTSKTRQTNILTMAFHPYHVQWFSRLLPLTLSLWVQTSLPSEGALRCILHPLLLRFVTGQIITISCKWMKYIPFMYFASASKTRHPQIDCLTSNTVRIFQICTRFNHSIRDFSKFDQSHRITNVPGASFREEGVLLIVTALSISNNKKDNCEPLHSRNTCDLNMKV
jgi:hypothetical protein